MQSAGWNGRFFLEKRRWSFTQSLARWVVRGKLAWEAPETQTEAGTRKKRGFLVPSSSRPRPGLVPASSRPRPGLERVPWIPREFSGASFFPQTAARGFVGSSCFLKQTPTAPSLSPSTQIIPPVQTKLPAERCRRGRRPEYGGFWKSSVFFPWKITSQEKALSIFLS